ncbi:homoserine dehydrogenase [Lacticaseibacillus baoqingensis]|uniref:Homoserine dehydrogenase n=1 Tax=Lacticaseibacillus baoqingensis TaxID=2486013 RepID=A0ABW4E8M9_9LACO|nr:homoserine dehydrogenase [Lacticaseibacillus baoqingensis]
MTTINVGLLGLGTVGRGVATILARQTPQLASLHLKITRAAVRTLTPKRQAQFPAIALTTDALAVVNDPDIQIIVEVMGGIDLPFALLKQALKNGKQVITANKDLIATHGQALTALAAKHHVGLNYEAAVMGGIPILRTLNTNFAGDAITGLAGIANGTSNFILTQMAAGCSYAEALAQAQAKGFAESDPTNDVEGLDAAYKLLILTRLAFDLNAKLANIHRQGITTLRRADFAAADFFGFTIKPLVSARRLDNQLDLTVAPTLVPKSHPLSGVVNEFNAIVLASTNTHELMLTGPGAGSLPTANAVIADLQATALALQDGHTPELAGLAPQPSTALDQPTRQLIALSTNGLVTGLDVATQLGIHGQIYASGDQLHLLTQAVDRQTIAQWRDALNHFVGISLQHILPIFSPDLQGTVTKFQTDEKKISFTA